MALLWRRLEVFKHHLTPPAPTGHLFQRLCVQQGDQSQNPAFGWDPGLCWGHVGRLVERGPYFPWATTRLLEACAAISIAG